MKNLLLIIGFVLWAVLTAVGQDTAAHTPKLVFNGYLKDMQTLSFNKDFSELLTGNLLHNRINVKWKPTTRISAVAEFRNRFIWGEEVKATPGYVSFLRNENEAVNLQKIWLQKPSMVLLTNIERLYLDYGNEQLNVRIGRQRINWGIATTWNPNDIFNSYNFLDFDYEERAGVDAGQFRYRLNNSSNIELAYAYADQKNGNVAALKYSINRWNYDIQLITGWYHDQPTLGAGWAGNIKDAGFKGELQYYFSANDAPEQLNLVLQSDYMFQKGWYLNLSILYNNKGISQPIENWNRLNLKISPTNLMPVKWNIMVTSGKELTPLLSANLIVLYSPGTNLLILYPSFQYNMAANLDLNLFWQSFFAEIRNNFEAVNHQAFLRLKWSF